WPDLAETRLVPRLVPSPLEPFSLAATHEGAWYGADPTGYKFVRRGSHVLNGLQPWIQYQSSRKQGNNDEYRHALKTRSNVSWMETFIKPCTFGAPQAATGLDKHLHPGAGVAMSCRTMPRPEKPLDIGRLI